MIEPQPLERLIDLAEVLRQTGLGKTRALGRVGVRWNELLGCWRLKMKQQAALCVDCGSTVIVVRKGETKRVRALQTQREAFEQWAKSRSINLCRKPGGEYAFPVARNAWFAFQAGCGLQPNNQVERPR